MIKINYSGQDVWIVNDAPNWSYKVGAEVSILSQTNTRLTNRESRRGHGVTLRFNFSFTASVNAAKAQTLIGAIRTITTERVAIPFWPAMTTWANRGAATITGGLKIAFKRDFSQFDLYEGVEPGWPAANDFFAPVIVGRLEKKEPRYRSPDLFTHEFNLMEESKAAWAIIPPATVFTTGPKPSGSWGFFPDIMPFAINFSNMDSRIAVAILREQIGFTREMATTHYSQSSTRGLDGIYTVPSIARTSQMLAFFSQHGAGAPFWVLANNNAATLTAPIGVADTVINVRTSDGVNIGDWITFINAGSDLSTAIIRKVTNKTGTTITLSSAPGAFPVATLITPVLLARFDQPKIAIIFPCNSYGQVAIAIKELPPEMTPAADETLGVTLGNLPTRVWLYEFIRVLNGVTFVSRFTSFESDLTGVPVPFIPDTIYNYPSRIISHGTISYGLQLDADSVDIKTDAFSDNPLIQVVTMIAPSPVTIRIIQADYSAGTAINGAVVFVGEFVSANVKGSRITGNAVIGRSIFDRQVPRLRFMPMCNNCLFDAGCNLLQADWKFTARISNAGTPGYPFTFDCDLLVRSAPVKATVQRGRNANIATLKVTAHGYVDGTHLKITGLGGVSYNVADTGPITIIDADHFSYANVAANEGTTGDVGGSVTWAEPTYTADYFSGGWVEFHTAGGDELNWYRRQITSSTSPIAGALTITLDGDPIPFPVFHDNIVMYPGCDLTAGTCKTRFNNYPNFIGHPFMPVTNPSLSYQSTPTTSKK